MKSPTAKQPEAERNQKSVPAAILEAGDDDRFGDKPQASPAQSSFTLTINPDPFYLAGAKYNIIYPIETNHKSELRHQDLSTSEGYYFYSKGDAEDTVQSAFSTVQERATVEGCMKTTIPENFSAPTLDELKLTQTVVTSLMELPEPARSTVLDAIGKRLKALSRRQQQAKSPGSSQPLSAEQKTSHEAKRLRRVAEKTKPPPPPGRQWPTETYSEANKSRNVRIIQFLEDPNGWFPLIRDGLVTLKILREVDPSAAEAVNKYTKAKRGTKTGSGKREHRPLPPHLDIPTQQELTDRKIAAAGGLQPALQSKPDLIHALASRVRRGSAVPGL